MKAVQKFKIIQPHLEWNISLSEISRQKSIPLRTVQRWVRRYREEGLIGLEHRPRSDKNIYRSVTEQQVKMIRALALEKPRLSISTIYRKITDLAKQHKQLLPKYDVVYNIITNMDAGLMTLAHDGSTAYRDKFEIIYRREISSVNEIWQADHTPLDIFLLNEKGEAQKPWLTIIEDDYSRAICGFYLTFEHPNAINTALALRQAIWKKKNPKWQVCGIPQILYTDNGSDFISKHIEKVCISLKIRMINTIPGRPQGKGRVERFFLTLLTQLLERLPGYAPRGFSKTKPKLTLIEFSQKLEDFIINDYHQTKHSTTKQLPIDNWLGDGFLPQLPESLEQLDLLLLTVPKTRKVRRDGIYFNQLRYMSTTLAAFVGEQVTIRYDPRDLAEIRVYFEGKFVCPAICQDIANQVISLKEIKKARQKRRRELRKEINNSKELLREDISKKAAKPIQKNIPIKAKKQTIKLYRNE